MLYTVNTRTGMLYTVNTRRGMLYTVNTSRGGSFIIDQSFIYHIHLLSNRFESLNLIQKSPIAYRFRSCLLIGCWERERKRERERETERKRDQAIPRQTNIRK